MGQGCTVTKGPAPIYKNVCSPNIGDLTSPSNVCLLFDVNMPGALPIPPPDEVKDQFCKKISPEWKTSTGLSRSCISTNDGFTQGIGTGDCGTNGSTVTCERTKFTGDPLKCCLNNVNCTGQCWSDKPDASGKQTCDPNTRNQFAGVCPELLSQYCTGTLPTDDPNSSAWLRRWNATDVNSPSNCYNLFLRRMQINTDPNKCPPPVVPTLGVCNLPTEELDAIGWSQNQALMTQVFERYRNLGYQLGTDPGQPGYNAFQEFLYTNICCPYSGMCSSAIKDVCAVESAQRISLNPTTAKWCGCHLPVGEYQAYHREYGIQPQCTPMCNRANVIQQAGRDMLPLTCTTNTCIIDNVTVNLLNSNVQGGLNFQQMCGKCGAGTCSCIISNSSVNIIDSTVGGSLVPALQSCSSSASTCTQSNAGDFGPSNITVPCSNTSNNIYNTYNELVVERQSQNRRAGILWTLVILGFLLLLVVIFIWWLY